MRVLLADDERLLADTVAGGLRKLAMAVDVCYDGEAALERLSVHRYDVAVLDRDMPHRTGDEVCRWAVGAGLGTRILILTAAAGIRDRVDGLALGADDYLTKPFAFAELAARVQTLARRPPVAAPPVLEHAGVEVDIPRHRAFRDGRLLDLTPRSSPSSPYCCAPPALSSAPRNCSRRPGTSTPTPSPTPCGWRS